MPHSSGGGSSRGGSHSGYRERHIRRSYHHGDKRFVRYKKDGSFEYVYSDRNIGLLGKSVNFLGIILAGLLTFGSFSIVIDGFKPPEKIDVSSYNSEIYIEDGANVIDNPVKLGNRLDEFQDLTGISICVKTMYDSELDGDNLEDYAYDEYLKKFDDEKHWLLVYSKNDLKGKNKWSWEGMQGDDTDFILTTGFAEKFTKEVQRSLEDGESFDVAVTKGLDRISPKIMKSMNFSLIFGSLMLIVIIWYGAYSLCIEGKTGNRTRYLKIPGDALDDVKVVRCRACSKEYVKESVPCCPYCYNVSRYKFDPFYRKKVKEELDLIPHD